MNEVREIMSENPAYCVPETSLETVAKMMIDNDCGEIPVVETEANRIPIGVVTDRDIVCRTVAKGLNPLELTAEDCMTMPCLFVGETESIDQCREILEENQIRRLVIVDEAGLISGIVSQADIVRADPEHASELVREISEPSTGDSITLFP